MGTSRRARRRTPIRPARRLADALETTRIQRVAGRTGARTALVPTRPYRAPPPPIAAGGRIGGGQVPGPGAVSRAHHGVLVLDERPACRRHVLEVLRQPLLRRVFSTDNLPHVIDLTALAVLTALAAHVQTATGAQAAPRGG